LNKNCSNWMFELIALIHFSALIIESVLYWAPQNETCPWIEHHTQT
jgi:hypothetical protein